MRYVPTKSKAIGKKYHNFTIISGFRDLSINKTFINCLCDCGKVFKMHIQNLHGKRATKSCGCAQIKHGHTVANKRGKFKSKEYSIWDNMKRRCHIKYVQVKRLPPQSIYRKLIKSGKALDPRWLDFKEFYKDMGPCPKDKTSIDRIDNSKGYFKSNCRWATHKEQMNNTSRTIKLTHNGKTKSVQGWATEFNINYSTIKGMRRRGMTLAEISNLRNKQI